MNRRISYPAKGSPIFEDVPRLPQKPPRITFSSSIYDALEKGGELTDIATKLEVTPSVLRKHIRQAEKSGRWKFTVTQWRTIARSGRKVIAAGRLRRL